jgi:hypothetical protein
MSILTQFSDPYDRRARLYPMTIVLLPLGLAASCWVPWDWQLLSAVGGVVVSVGVSALLSQIGRDRGKAKEPDLWRQWGGKPSVVALQYRSGLTNEVTLRRCHAKLKEIDPQLEFAGSKEEELQDTSRFDASYDSASDLLLSRTRDKTAFPLVFEENVNYGFRRNLWAMKRAGIAICVLGVLGTVIRAWYVWLNSAIVSSSAVVCLIVSAALLALWIMCIRPTWIKTTADAFAKQLVNACDRL